MTLTPPTAAHWNQQRPSGMPSYRYRDVHDRVDIPLRERTWPTRRLSAAPLWVPVDLRDGNQALAEPMDPARKRRFFELMVRMGYTEIEVGYPSASRTDFDFVRLIAETDIAPEHVTIVVFTAARADLIDRTIASIAGIRNPVVIHVYAATAPAWRDVVLGKTRAELSSLVLAAGERVLRGTERLPNVRCEFSPEVFNLTEPDYVLDLCDRMTELWDATPERPVILNLPATVEIASPNVYADQIEYMSQNLARREGVILSVHPHNDRGTGIACAELAVLAGAQRVEGCIFGNGERTGNVDIATLALNLHAQGIDPMIDFSDIDEVRRTVEYCTRMPVSERHPYVGDLVYTAFSGTHQDAIKKGLAWHHARAAEEGVDPATRAWTVPYLPIDPADVGRSYDAVIRVNSQSGKGGIAYLLLTDHGLDLPRRLQIDFSARVQRHTETSGAEINSSTLRTLFDEAYLGAGGGVRVLSWETRTGEDGSEVAGGMLSINGQNRVVERRGQGPIDALISALDEAGIRIEVHGLTQQSLERGSAGRAVTYLEYGSGDTVAWSAGIAGSVLAASVAAVAAAASAVSRAAGRP